MSNRNDRIRAEIVRAVQPVVLANLMLVSLPDLTAIVEATMRECAARIAADIDQEGDLASDCTDHYELCADVAACWPARSPKALNQED